MANLQFVFALDNVGSSETSLTETMIVLTYSNAGYVIKVPLVTTN